MSCSFWIVCEMGGQCLYSCCFVRCCFQEMFIWMDGSRGIIFSGLSYYIIVSQSKLISSKWQPLRSVPSFLVAQLEKNIRILHLNNSLNLDNYKRCMKESLVYKVAWITVWLLNNNFKFYATLQWKLVH